LPLRYVSPLHKAYRQLGLYLDGRMAELGILPGEAHLISFLFSYEPSPISELIRIFGLKKSTLTGRLDRLVDRGLITREVNPQDRRSFLVRLTPAGRRLAPRINRVVEELEARIDARIGRRAFDGYRRVLGAIGEATGVDVRPRRQGAPDPRQRKEK
jgi:DNA-binding MarR family transcriptional regulator